MGLSAHEMILVLKARDEASRVLRGFSNNLDKLDRDAAARAQRQFAQGSALATSGVAIAGTSLAAANAMNNMTDAAMEYGEQVALTATQVDGAGVSIKELHKMGLDLAREMPVQFEEVQTALYDIFSSIEVNGPEAETILRGIGKASVAGKVDMESAGRGILQIMNAWKMKASEVNDINDVMFQLVRKGVGTYEQFTSTIGRAIPSTVRAGGSVQDLAGMMAFLTRNGLSTAQASTSAARAFDAMTNPRTASNMEKFGISVKDAEGNFRPMLDVVTDMRTRLSGMNDTARSQALKEMFAGSGGTIQAMRFFNLGVKDSKGLLKELTDYMRNAGGAASEAYDIMSKTPQAKIQEMKNKYAALKVEVGDKLLPIKLKLVEALGSLMDKFSGLSDGTQNFLVKFAVIATVGGLVLGVVMAIAGTLLMFAAAATMAGVTLGTVALAAGGVIIALGLLAAAGYLIYKNWDTIKAKAQEVWGSIVSFMQPTIDNVKVIAAEFMKFGQQLWGILAPKVMSAFESIKNGLTSAWAAIQPGFQAIGDAINYITTKFADAKNGTNALSATIGVFKAIIAGAVSIVGSLVEIVGGVLGPLFSTIGAMIGNVFKVIAGVFKMIFAILTGDWSTAWQAAKDVVYNIFAAIGNLLKGAVQIIWNIIKGLVTGIIDFFTTLWDVLVGHSIIPDMVTAIIKWIAMLPVKVLSLIAGLVSKVISWFVKMASQAGAKVASLVTKVVSYFADLAVQAASKVSNMVTRVIAFFVRLVTTAATKAAELVRKVISFYLTLPGKAISAISSLAGKMAEQGRKWMNSLYSAVSSAWGKVMSFFRSVPDKIKSGIGNAASMLSGVGRNIIEGLIGGIKAMAGRAVGAVKDVVGDAISSAKNLLGINSPSKVFMRIGEYINVGFIKGVTGTESKAISTIKSLNTKIISAMNLKPGAAKQLKSWQDQRAKLKRLYRDMAQDRNKEYAKSAKKRSQSKITSLDRRMRENAIKQRQLLAKINSSSKENKAAVREARRAAKAKRAVDKYDGYLISIAKQRETLAKKIKNAQKKVEDAIKVRDDFAKSVAENFGKLGDLASIMDGSEEADNSANSLIQKLQTNLKAINDFQSKLSQLQKAGVSKEIYQQIVEAGPEKGTALADSLLKGGPEAIKQVNTLTAQIKGASENLGDRAARTLYQAGVDSANGLLKGLQSKEAALAKSATRIAKLLVSSIKKALKIKSPSRVMSDLGVMGGEGWVQGLLSQEAMVANAGRRLALAAVQQPGLTSTTPQVAHAMPATGNTNHFDITVNTQEINPVKHAADLGYELAGRLGM